MMVRLVGAALLILGGLGLGLAAAGRLSARVRDLRELESAVETLERELGWRLAPLPEGLLRAAEGAAGGTARLFRLCAEEAVRLNGRSFRQVWAACIGDAQLCLDREDAAILAELGSVLGRYDGDSQRQALERAAERLAGQRERAVERRDRLGRLYGILGAGGGLLLVILLF